MIDISRYIAGFSPLFPELRHEAPWKVTGALQQILTERIAMLNGEYHITGNIAVHRTAIVEDHVVLKGPVIVSKNCFIGAHAYLRGGVFLDERVVVGPGCEVKSSMLFSGSALAHFNFVGDSLIGSQVNMEAGSVIANHFNEREQKTISVLVDGTCVATGAEKFGSLTGDRTKIGANAVLSPGTILGPGTIVRRLALIEQCK